MVSLTQLYCNCEFKLLFCTNSTEFKVKCSNQDSNYNLVPGVFGLSTPLGGETKDPGNEVALIKRK